MIHIAEIVPAVLDDVVQRTEDARIERVFAALEDALCNRCAASFRLDGDALCAECRHEIDTVFGHLVEGE